MRLVVSERIPHHRRRGTRNDAVRRSYWVGVPVFAYGADGEVSGSGEERCEVPSKGDVLALSYFEEGSCSLRRLGDCDASCRSGLRNGTRAGSIYG